MRKADRHGKLVREQTLYELILIFKIENGIVHTTDGRYVKISEIEPINFLLRSPREQRSIIASFAAFLKIAPVSLQIKSVSRKAGVNAYISKLRKDARTENDVAVLAHHKDYLRFVRRLGTSDAVSRRFFAVIEIRGPNE